MSLVALAPDLDFELTPGLEAVDPPEIRGAGRDDVRLLVANRADGRIRHQRFDDLPGLLQPGDLLVVNTSATIAAALDGRVGSQPAVLHLSTPVSQGEWIAELRHVDPVTGVSTPWLDAPAGTEFALADGARAVLVRPATPTTAGAGVRLWHTVFAVGEHVGAYLARRARPIRYGHSRRELPLDAYQTVFADEPGSVEMPSAARPFTGPLVTRLVVRGVALAPITLHCGVSSPEAHEPPARERFRVPADSANRVNAARRVGGRVIAVGTTVVRALASASRDNGLVMPADGWTEVVVDREHPARAVDGLLTGWHEPRASHLALLEAIAGTSLLQASYAAAVEAGYLWHEFGDSHLVLP